MGGNQHAVGPGTVPRIQWARRLPVQAIEAQLLVGLDPQRASRMRRWSEGNPAIKYGDLRAIAELAHIQACGLGLQGAVGGKYLQGTRVLGCGQQHLAFEQANHPLLTVKPHINRTGRVELDLAAIVQFQRAALSHRAAEVRQQRGDGQLIAQAVGQRRTGAQQQQQFQGLTAAGAFGCIQGGMGQW